MVSSLSSNVMPLLMLKTQQGGSNKKEIQLNLYNIFSTFIFNELYLYT